MRKLVIALVLITGWAHVALSVGRTRTTASMKAGEYQSFGNNTTLDTIGVSDTLTYITYIESEQRTNPIIQITNTKISSGTATFAITLWQSLDGTNYEQCVKGAAQSAYSKSASKSASGFTIINPIADTVIFTGRYLKTRIVTNSTASVKQRLTYKY